LRRLFSTFARGWPGVGLLLMRLVVGIALIDRGVTRLWSAYPIQVIILCVLATGTGALLLAGLWTPVAGTLVAAIEMWKIFFASHRSSTNSGFLNRQMHLTKVTTAYASYTYLDLSE
jgi:hypothetical protein